MRAKRAGSPSLGYWGGEPATGKYVWYIVQRGNATFRLVARPPAAIRSDGVSDNRLNVNELPGMSLVRSRAEARGEWNLPRRPGSRPNTPPVDYLCNRHPPVILAIVIQSRRLVQGPAMSKKKSARSTRTHRPSADPLMETTANLSLTELRQMLRGAERSAGPESQTATLLRRLVERRENTTRIERREEDGDHASRPS